MGLIVENKGIQEVWAGENILKTHPTLHRE